MLSTDEIYQKFGDSNEFEKLHRNQSSYTHLIHYIGKHFFPDTDINHLSDEIIPLLSSDAKVYEFLRSLNTRIIDDSDEFIKNVNITLSRYTSDDFRKMNVLVSGVTPIVGHYLTITDTPVEGFKYDLVILRDSNVDYRSYVGKWLYVSDSNLVNMYDIIGYKIFHYLNHGVLTGEYKDVDLDRRSMTSYVDLEKKVMKYLPGFRGSYFFIASIPDVIDAGYSLDTFIPYYNPDKMSTKKEFRELIRNMTAPYSSDNFFSNYQELPARWFAPITGNKIALIRWSVGMGKTREALKWSFSWLKDSHYKNVIFLSGSKLITRTISDELVNYFNFNQTLDEVEYKMGRRSHGRTIAITRFANRQGYKSSTIITFMNGIIADHTQSGDDLTLKEYIQYHYRNHIVIVDEVHLARKTSEDKKLYQSLEIFLDAVRDVSPILLLTATPVIDTWYDIVSIIGLLYPPEQREIIFNEFDTLSKSNPNTNTMKFLITKYLNGKVSDLDPIGLPEKVMIPNLLNFRDGEFIKYKIDGEEIADSLYPIIMSSEQTEVTTIAEARVTDTGEDRPNDFYIYQRTLYDFIFSTEDVGNYVLMDPIKQEYIINANTQSYLSDDGTIENKFLVYWREPNVGEIDRWNDMLRVYYSRHGLDPSEYGFLDSNTKFVNPNKGLGKYSAKNAELLWMTKYHPMVRDKPGYIHTLWVKNGTENIAGSFITNGWKYWNGNQEWNMDVIPPKPMFVIISGGSKQSSPNKLNNILKLYNHEKNRDGKYLRLVIGSKASGISLSLSNGRFFIELSFDYNRTTLIQSEGRVFRRDSLSYRSDRKVFVAYMIGLPRYIDNIYNGASEGQGEENEYYADIMNGDIRNKLYPSTPHHQDMYPINPRTTEIHIYNISRKKYKFTEIVYDAVKDASIERIITRDMDKPEDESTHRLLYADEKKESIVNSISSTFLDKWNYTLNNDPYVIQAAAELISSNTMMTSWSGIPYPIQATVNGIALGQYNYTGNLPSLCYVPTVDVLSRVYTQKGIISETTNTYSQSMVINALSSLISRSNESEFSMLGDILASTDIIKVIYLEAAIENTMLPDSLRAFILDLFNLYWDVYSDGSVVHILSYAVHPKAYQTKKGINNRLPGNTRKASISFAGDKPIVNGEWIYIDSSSIESIYFSNFNNKVMREEERVRDNTFRFFGSRIVNDREYGWFLYISLADGILRLREIYEKDLRKKKTYALNQTLDPYYREVINEIFTIAGKTFDENNYTEELYTICKQYGILLIK